MFQALQPLLTTVASLTISMVENADGTITLTVIPIGVKKGSNLDSQMSITATAAELDDGFTVHLASYTAKRETLANQLAATEATLEAMQKEAADKAKKSIAKPAKKSSTPSSDNPEGSDDDENGDDDTGASCTASASTEQTSTATTPAAATPASDLWG
jgi:PRTRC genetic system protein E